MIAATPTAVSLIAYVAALVLKQADDTSGVAGDSALRHASDAIFGSGVGATANSPIDELLKRLR
ncbi:MAG: hypothetical protein LBV54_06665, partial [Puniceicoccales bacterium]|nr:hypothetical protein [Puniceicoccales bacterium]